MANVLIIDDSELVCSILARVIGRLGHEVVCVGTLGEGLEAARNREFDVTLLDVFLPDGNGLDILPRLQASPRPPEVIIITSEGDPRGAALAIENGAWDYLEKGAPAEKVILSLARALQYREKKAAAAPAALLRREGIIGSSRRLRDCLDQAAKAAASEASVLVTGETGTGKELFARAIHQNSPRVDRPFVVVDCAALPDNLVESILFGHVKGAFTGADRDCPGLATQADGGTLFLDEVGELPLSMQKAFLRVLQDRKFRPVGAKTEVHSDFRLVAATNRDLDDMAAKGSFRSDLLFRIRSFHIVLPPLRVRQEDVRELAAFLMTRLCERYGLERKTFSEDFLEALEAHRWPGNVRELAHTLERAVIKARMEPELYPKHLPTEIRTQYVQSAMSGQRSGLEGEGAPTPVVDAGQPPRWREYRDRTILAAGKKYFRELMDSTGGDIKKACELSGLSVPRLYALLKEHEISKRFTA